ncbi:putative isoaspartyl peptidase/L-asparaginase [Lasiodiplodia theobromae]|uniref:Putative isoaspartyl peptidase/L-asparaginase n=1 Tax=Lasiodiplodia theobromae TaxID=45133 RepID=A0A5N5DVF4_9PEZI|nr:putative isoaspartyl peptidase/L-asparaginase [Lasiodiplodia theobromae]
MTSSKPTPTITPRIIIHGGAGNISRANVPADSYAAYRASLHRILTLARAELANNPAATALDVAVYAVSLFEDDPLFNAGRGAVFTRAGTNELEASVMVSRGHHKRGAGVMLLRHVKNPIKLAREILVRGDDAEGNGGGAQAHVQLAGGYVEELAKGWGLEMVEPDYFFTQKRWDEHVKGLERGKGAVVSEDTEALAGGDYEEEEGKKSSSNPNDPSWDGKEYLPQGTVGAVVLDRFGTICAATSTGGLTNKLPGRIGDTPTLGAGYWAEEWIEEDSSSSSSAAAGGMSYHPAISSSAARSPIDKLSRGDIPGLLSDCLGPLSSSSTMSSSSSPSPGQATPSSSTDEKPHPRRLRHAVGMSGTGNGDSFLRVCAARTAAAIPRFSSSVDSKKYLRDGLAWVAGPGGELQRSAGDRWENSGEGQGGIIGIELVTTAAAAGAEAGAESAVQRSWVGYDLNCGGMFRAWVDGEGRERVAVFADEDGSEGW